MKIRRSDWQKYINQLAAINKKASGLMESWLGSNPNAEGEQIVNMAYRLATRYGEASASLACDMYDEIATAQKARVPAAEPAPTATFDETAKAIYGTMKNQRSTVPSTVGRLVKQSGADTMLQNARRDGAQFAWIPMGDTCSFCLTLASRGWQRQSRRGAERHAAHIHANCDCEYCVRFDGVSTVEGYDPDALYEQYKAADGNTPQEKINAMRREHYAAHKDEINAQKRAAYAKKAEGNERDTVPHPVNVTDEYMKSASPGVGALIIEDEAHSDTHSDEIRVAELIHRKLGGDITIRKEIPGQENADYLWRSHLWELKSPQSEKNLNKLIQKGISQTFDDPGGIVVERGEIDLERAVQIINGRMKTSLIHPLDVMIVSGERIEMILRYKK